MPLSLPYQILAGQFVTSKPVRDNFQAIVDKFSANITDADIAAVANVAGTKLLDGSVPGAKIVPGGIGSTQLAVDAVLTANIKDSTAATDGVTTSKIAAGAVTGVKLAAGAALANIVAGSILYGRLKVQVTTVSLVSNANSDAVPNAKWDRDLTTTTQPAGTTLTNPITGGSAGGFPFLIESGRTAGGPPVAADRRDIYLIPSIYRDFTSAKWYLQVRLADQGTVTPLAVDQGGWTYEVYWFSLA